MIPQRASHVVSKMPCPSKAVIDQIGGEKAVKQLVETFYDFIEAHPSGRGILELHQDGHGLRHARIEQFDFMCGFLGGRRYYFEKHKHMNVKQIHEHVAIRQIDADNWLICMDMAMAKCDINPAIAEKMRQTFKNVAKILINT